MLDEILHSLDALEILLVRTMDGPCNTARRDSRTLTQCLDRRTENVDAVDAHCPKPLTYLGAQGTVGDGVQNAERPPLAQELPDSSLDYVCVVDLRQALDGDLDSVELTACSAGDFITRRTQRIGNDEDDLACKTLGHGATLQTGLHIKATITYSPYVARREDHPSG